MPQAYSSRQAAMSSSIQLISSDAAPSVIKKELEASICGL